ncbi:MAG: acyl-CoA dehydrogenase family protein [Acidimicrobiales bacterium]
MKLHYDSATEAFRAEFAAWLEDHRPSVEDMESDPPRSSAHAPAWARSWQRRLFDAGWLVPGWPPELGGRSATPVQQMVYFEEFSRHDVPRTTNPQGLSIVAPSILDFGDDDQRERYAMPLLRGEKTACLGMSEPGAGSDLAGLTTRAEIRGDSFLVNGQKVWTSGAHHADFCFCLTRTDPSAPKHRGISVLVIDMDTPGVTWRPLARLVDNSGHHDFNEVYFDDVVVPRDNLVGELNQGWAVGSGSLAHERGMMWVGAASMLDSSVAALIAEATADDRCPRSADDAVVRDQLADLYIDAQALKCMGYRSFAAFGRGSIAAGHSILKMFASETARRLNLVGTELIGAQALDLSLQSPGPKSRFDGSGAGLPWAHRYLTSFGGTIAGGTSEIQRNIVAERVLGLPRG